MSKRKLSSEVAFERVLCIEMEYYETDCEEVGILKACEMCRLKRSSPTW